MKLNRECSLQADIQWSPTTAHIFARGSANPPQQISMLPRTFQRIMYFPTARKIWKFCRPQLVSIRRMRLRIICSEPCTCREVYQAKLFLTPQIPVLHASLGRALLREKDDPEKALSVFQEGLRADPANVELYTGMDQALSILRRPPEERVAALERYPDHAHIPSNLVYELILNLVEAGEFEKADALFHNRFFPREEGGINVREVWLEVQRATSFARSGRCADAVGLVDHLAEPVPDLPFTHDGLEPFVRSARFSYLIGNVYKGCGVHEKSQASFERSAQQTGLGNAVWSWKASKELPDFDESAARQKLNDILERSNNDGERSAWWLYNRAMLDSSVGNDQQAQKEFREALLAPDHLMAYHLTRLAVSSNP
jgi:tetratricopeptide (TPR) repeat protein